jgi:pimeloyl-ACP methyl ester carboxylesterase
LRATVGELLEIQVGGLRIAYERAGDGPPLLLLHGYVGDGKGTWQRQLDALSDEFTVVAWDGPGAGKSSDPPESFRMTDYADCLAGFIEGLGLERPHVGGLSFGGGLAIELYRRHPTIARSLILASAYAGWAGSLPPEVVQQRLTQALSLADMPSERLVREVVPTMFSRSAPAVMIEDFARNMSAFHPVGFRTMALAVAEADLRDVLPLIAIPTLLLYGDEDVRAPLDVAEALHASIPGSKLAVLHGVGHISSVEGADRFNDEVRAFLRSVGSHGW